jgi:hypothetical protein
VFAFLYPHREKSQEILSRMHPTFLGVFVREYWYWLNSPFIKLFLAIKITPNMITIISLALGFVCAYFYYAGSFALAGWLLIISATLDILDGQLARLTGKVSKEGAFLDSCADHGGVANTEYARRRHDCSSFTEDFQHVYRACVVYDPALQLAR